jgi:ubiquinone/menaquinone biosynthesis C-methylase UbiE
MGRDSQRRDWTDVSERRREIMVKHMVPMWASLLDATHAGPGTRVLDAGCGSGELVGLALERECVVVGTDLAPGMMQLCKSTPRLAAASFFEASTEELPFENDRFDVVISSMSIHFCDDVTTAFRELHRVVKPGGYIGISAPSSPDLNVLIAFKVAMELVPEQAADFGRPMMFAEDGKLARQLVAIGFRDITERVAETPVIEDTFEKLWEVEKTWAPIRKASEVVGEARFLQAYQDRLRERTGDPTPTELDLAYRVVSGIKELH